MSRVQAVTIGLLSLVLSICATGCGSKFFDPTQVGRFRPTPAVNVILDSLGVAEETPIAWEKTEEPRPSDIVAVQTDYVFRAGDAVRVSIYELYQEGMPAVNDYVVTETGKISIPEVGVIQAAGLTETQLEDEIKRIVSPGILIEPSVSVSLVNSQQRTFSILGEGVTAPNRYVIPRYNFRLADALASAGGVRQFNVSYIYVSRSTEDEQDLTEPAENEAPKIKTKLSELQMIEPTGLRPETFERAIPEPRLIEPKQMEPQLKLEREMLEMITPSTQNPRLNQEWPESKKLSIGYTEVASNKEPSELALRQRLGFSTDRRWTVTTGTRGLTKSSPALSSQKIAYGSVGGNEGDSNIEWIFRDGKWVPIPVEAPKIAEPAIEEEKIGGRVDWIFKEGKWVPIPSGSKKPTEPAVKFEPEKPSALKQKLPEELKWEDVLKTRVIKISVAKLLAGDPRYNIVIKPGDTIHVPVDIIGEFAIMGNVNQNGYINITGRPMTLKMAIAAAGGLGPLAWPKRCEVVRRIGENKEEIVMVDLDKIASGEQPDFFIKPNDLINVGTHFTARWRAILRNAFRATYGYGFVYDRNFADVDYGKDYPRPHWF
jgi:protein involved in polysaccharide export with SLBB domain